MIGKVIMIVALAVAGVILASLLGGVVIWAMLELTAHGYA